MKIEITRPLELDSNTESYVNLHSFINIINVLVTEYYLLGDYLGDTSIFQDCIDKLLAFTTKIKVKQNVIPELRGLLEVHRFLNNAVQKAEFQFGEKSKLDNFQTSKTNLSSIFDVMKVRAGEYLTRMETEDDWEEFSVNKLNFNMIQVLMAIELNSKGRYHIVHNIASKEQRDYFVQMEISSVRGDNIIIPSSLQDTFRDLIANARKYTKPGGLIIAGLYENENSIRLLVKDDGIGIPRDDIEKVIGLGFRATNTAGFPTKGGGVGLTKAYI